MTVLTNGQVTTSIRVNPQHLWFALYANGVIRVVMDYKDVVDYPVDKADYMHRGVSPTMSEVQTWLDEYAEKYAESLDSTNKLFLHVESYPNFCSIKPIMSHLGDLDAST